MVRVPIDQEANTKEANTKEAETVGYTPTDLDSRTHIKKYRRVGTVTMGICLIVTGIILIIHLFFPNTDLIEITQYAPIILVMLGSEILYNYFVHKEQQLRYDFLSTFFCGFIILIALGFAISVPLYKEYGSPRQQLINELDQQLYDIFYDSLQGNKNIGSMEVNTRIF